MSGQLWSVNSLGGFMYSDELSNVLRTALQPVVKFRQFCDAKDALDKGLNKGDTFNWNAYTDVEDGGTRLEETKEMPQTRYKIFQQSLKVVELGNSVPYSGLLDNLSKQPVTDVIHKVLKNDAKKTLDGEAHLQFNACGLRVAPTSGTATDSIVYVENGGTVGVTNNVAMGKDHIKAIVDFMKERNIPPYQGDDYFALGWPTTFRKVKNDLEELHKYVETGFTKIMNGEIGRYENVRFCEQTNVAKGGAFDSTTYNFRTADAWNNGKSDWAFFFGEDTVAEALCIPEEIRGKIPTDYGRSRGIAWYYLGGFGIVHSKDAQAASQRIVKWDSAA